MSDNGTRWQHEPHIRSGDPCYHCGTPMVPASRANPGHMLAPGLRRHGSYGLCSLCYSRRATDPQIAALVDQARRPFDQPEEN